jgi:hypothetical protein
VSRHRFTAKENPQMGIDNVVVTFRLPKTVLYELDTMVTEGNRPGIGTRTDALQDAVGVWLLLESRAIVEEQLSSNGHQEV